MLGNRRCATTFFQVWLSGWWLAQSICCRLPFFCNVRQSPWRSKLYKTGAQRLEPRTKTCSALQQVPAGREKPMSGSTWLARRAAARPAHQLQENHRDCTSSCKKVCPSMSESSTSHRASCQRATSWLSLQLDESHPGTFRMQGMLSSLATSSAKKVAKSTTSTSGRSAVRTSLSSSSMALA